VAIAAQDFSAVQIQILTVTDTMMAEVTTVVVLMAAVIDLISAIGPHARAPARPSETVERCRPARCSRALIENPVGVTDSSPGSSAKRYHPGLQTQKHPTLDVPRLRDDANAQA
jgi:hypothetical protein